MIWLGIAFCFFLFDLPQSICCSKCSYDDDTSTPPSFGKEMKSECFDQLDQNAIFLNHGAFGVPVHRIYQKVKEMMDLASNNPDRWYWSFFHKTPAEPFGASEGISLISSELAKFLNVDDSEDIVLVGSATEGVNSVLRSYPFSDKDTILYLSFEYMMVKNCIQWVSDRFGTSIKLVHLTLPITSPESVIKQVIEALETTTNKITFAVLDHISSKPTAIFPLKELIEILHERDIPVFVDGAHSFGQIPIDIQTLDPDFYTSNLHKWGYAATETAFLYVNKKYQSTTYTPLISCYYKQGFRKDFSWMATRDWSPRMSILEVLKFRSWVGDERIMEYSNGLCKDVAGLFEKDWGDQGTVVIPQEMFASIVTVHIPCKNKYLMRCEGEKEDQEEEEVCEYDWEISEVRSELEKRNIWTFFVEYDGKRYLRVSCAIYNDLDDYITFKEILNELIGWK